MNLREIDIAEFDNMFPERPTVFDSGQFNMLNSDKAESVVAIAAFDNDSKPLVGQILGLRDGVWRAPFSAPFSAASTNEAVNRDMSTTSFYKSLTNHLDAPIRLVWPSQIYEPGEPPTSPQTVNEANFHYDLSRFPHYEEFLSRSGRYNHHRALKHDFNFFKTDDIARAYSIIAANRMAMGYPLAMSLDQVKATVSGPVRADFFVMTLDGEDMAAAMLYEVTPKIMQVIYWGDLPESRHARAMNHLAWRVFGWYAVNRPEIKIIDIGPASTDGVRNEGLCQFKMSIGCEETPRPTLTINNY